MEILSTKESLVLDDLLSFDEISSIFDTRSSFWKARIEKSITYLSDIRTGSNEKVKIPPKDYVENAAFALTLQLPYLPEEKELLKTIKSLEFETQRTKKIAFNDLQNLTKNMSGDLSFEGKVLFLFLARAYE